MKKNILCLVMLAIILAFGMTVVGCGDDNDPTPQTVTYSGTADGTTYTLTIDGDSYVLTLTGTDGTKTSTGTVTKNGNTLTLTPSYSGVDTFTITVSPSGITDIDGKITLDNGDKEDPPDTVTPKPPSTGGTDPFAGTWEAEGVKIVAADGSFETSRDGKVFNKGTYTCEGNNVTVTLTHVNPWMFGSDDDQLYTWAALPHEYKDNPEYNLSQIVQMTVTGNTFSWNGMTFTKQGGGNSGGDSRPAPKFTGVQVYTLDDGVFTAFSGTGAEMDVSGFMSDNYGQYDELGKIGIISSDGKLTLELPSTIADDKLFLVPTEMGGNGVTKFVFVGIQVYSDNDNSDDDYYLGLYNSSNTNGEVHFVYFDRDFSTMGLSVKKGWNYVVPSWDDDPPQIIFDISNHKWAIEQRK